MGLTVGLDVGIASVGWCVLDKDAEKILGAGVRVFQAAEDPKTGASLAAPRREARSIRRRLRRRRIRMQQFRELVVSTCLMSSTDLERAFELTSADLSPYELRVEGLHRRLTEAEWVRVLSQLCKRRGYKSMRLGEAKDDDEGVVKSAIAENESLMKERGYRTFGEMLAMDARFDESKRNKGDYVGVVSREQLLREVDVLFDAQRSLGNPFATEAIQDRYTEILTWQAPIKEGDALVGLVGACSIDGKNKRIPTACYTFERFRVVDKVNNIRYRLASGEAVSLTPEQKATVLARVFDLKTPRTLHDVRTTLKLPEDARFVGVRYGTQNGDDLSAEKKERLPHPRAWHAIRDAVRQAAEASWLSLSTNVKILDQIGVVLTYFKYDESVSRELTALGLEPEVVQALTPLRFSGNAHLSRETTMAILPGMESGLSYSDACAAAGLHHSLSQRQTLSPKLPPIPADEIRNPVVIRALSQSRKVLNAIIAEFGPIERLNIELGRDVARNRKDRDQMDRDNKRRRDANEDVLDELRKEFGLSSPRGQDLIKHKLWKEQDGRCPYSGVPIDVRRLFSGEHGIAEVDHILPHGRSFDDSYMNKVLVTTVENRNKGNRTPFEYLGGNPQQWHEFEERVESMHLPRPKRERLLRKDFDERAAEEFRERNLNDTRYISRFLKNFVEANLQFVGESKAPVMTVNGRATAYLRNAWRFQKMRAEGDLHHAMDAIIIAATTRSMVQRVSRFFSVRPLRNHEGQYVDTDTGELLDARHIPEPWEGFREHAAALLNARFSLDPLADIETTGGEIRPILVSRMPERSIRGEAHAQTVRRVEGRAEDNRIRTSRRVPLESLTPALLERMVGRERDRALFEALSARLAAFDGKGEKAFADPFHKPSKPGKNAPRVRSIRVYDDLTSGGAWVRGGLANNGEMVRTDVFERDGKYYLVPVYVKDVVAGALPDKAIVAFKAEEDWRSIDDSYRFAFSLFRNDLIRIVKKSKSGTDTYFGYFKGTDRSDGGLNIQPHDSTAAKAKKLGVAQGVVSFDKFEVDVLGRQVHRVKREHRRGFSNSGDSARS